MDQSNEKLPNSLGNSIYTFIVFVGFILLIPVFFCIFLYVKTCRFIWFRFLAKKYPHLEIVKRMSVRSAMDTYRCQGILTILLQIRGECDVELVKQKIQEDVLEKQNTDGSLRFPHMKKSLTSCWGRYAWVKDTSGFSIHNHVIYVQKPVLRNRIVTSANIQDYVSDVITKYLPPWNNIPPWQIMIIATEPDCFYLLARVHHLYIAEDNISFGHLLMIDPEDEWTETCAQDLDSIENVVEQIYQKPRAFPFLLNYACDSISNFLNELIAVYDPLQNRWIRKSSPNIFHFNIILIITTCAIFREYFKVGRNLVAIVKKEMSRQDISFRFFFQCFINTLYPFVLIRIIIASLWWFYIKCLLHLPITVLHVLYDTPIYFKWLFIVLRALGEILYILHLVYTAPRILLDELILPMFQLPKHHLQKVSLSGRKVVNWTGPIPVEMIRKIRDKTGVASCEIQLYGLAAALHEYFQKYNLDETEEILTTTRFIPQEHLLKSANHISSGLLCLSLPLNLPEDDALYGLHMMQLSLQDAMTNQTALYIASLWQYDYGLLTTVLPSILARIVLYVLSTRYSVMLTQIEAHTKEMKKRRLIWGQKVESFIYWRPPQANVSLSATLINYGDEMRFAVMADAELAPQYSIIVSRYEYHIKQLAEEAENYSSSTSGTGTPPAEL